MKNIQRMTSGVDVAPLLHAVQCRPDLWNRNTLMTAGDASPFREGSDIWIRFHEIPIPLGEPFDDRETVWYPAIDVLPEARSIVTWLMARVGCERLGRVVITKLAPGRRVHAHVDVPRLAGYYSRYHVPLQTSEGATFRCGDETVHMAAGEVWWFDNRVEHAAANEGQDDRLHLIIDIRSAGSGVAPPSFFREST